MNRANGAFGAGSIDWGEVFVGLAVLAAFVLAALLVLLFISRFASRLAKRSKTELDDKVVQALKLPAFLLILVTGFYAAALCVPSLGAYLIYVRKGSGAIATLIGAFLASRIVNIIAGWYSEKLSRRKKEDVSAKIVRTTRNVARVLVWTAAAFLLLDISEINIGPLVTSLGISGIIVAIALQSVLADLMTSFTIYLDRPFEPGDYVYIDDLKGTIEKVGLYSTRLKALRGEEIVISNKELRSKTVQNFKRMARRRVAFEIGVTYDTPAQKLKDIPGKIKTLIDEVPLASADRAHFYKFGPYSLDFEIVYYINTNDYTTYMDIQQQINIAIVELFEREGIEFAYPTQTLIIERPGNT
ncbi:MAG: mechanosensitive ion channel family protein [Candidatus Coatesbacteria bacterium]|nr:MAG: mechanosensitive ion channel family protein [Candidatus Coatesbacteria bacterium]